MIFVDRRKLDSQRTTANSFSQQKLHSLCKDLTLNIIKGMNLNMCSYFFENKAKKRSKILFSYNQHYFKQPWPNEKHSLPNIGDLLAKQYLSVWLVMRQNIAGFKQNLAQSVSHCFLKFKNICSLSQAQYACQVIFWAMAKRANLLLAKQISKSRNFSFLVLLLLLMLLRILENTKQRSCLNIRNIKKFC